MNHPYFKIPGAKNTGIYYGYVIVALSFIVMTLIPGIFYSFGVFFKPISADFGWTRAMTSGAFSMAWVVSGFTAIIIGGLNDRYGPRLVITICGILSGAGYLLLSQMNTLWQFYLFYGGLIGAGLSMFVPLLSTVARWFVKRRTIMSGIVICGIGIGAMVGPLLATWLIEQYEWRASFIILGAVILLSVILAAQFLIAEPSRIGKKAYGANTTSANPLRHETKSFTLKQAIACRQFWICCAIFFCFGFCFNALQIHIVPYATDRGINAVAAAGILAISNGSSIIGRVLLGAVGDHIGNIRSYILGLAMFLIASICLILSPELWAVYLFAVLFGFSWGNLATQQSPLVALLFGLASHGLIFAVIDLGFTIGSAVGPLVSGYIYDISGDYRTAFLLSAVASVTGIIITLFLRPQKLKPDIGT